MPKKGVIHKGSDRPRTFIGVIQGITRDLQTQRQEREAQRRASLRRSDDIPPRRPLSGLSGARRDHDDYYSPYLTGPYRSPSPPPYYYHHPSYAPSGGLHRTSTSLGREPTHQPYRDPDPAPSSSSSSSRPGRHNELYTRYRSPERTGRAHELYTSPPPPGPSGRRRGQQPSSSSSLGSAAQPATRRPHPPDLAVSSGTAASMPGQVQLGRSHHRHSNVSGMTRGGRGGEDGEGRSSAYRAY